MNEEIKLEEDKLDYKINFFKEVKTLDGRTLKGVEMQPITRGEYKIIKDIEDPFARMEMILKKQHRLTDEDLDNFDQRDMNKIARVIASFFPFGLI